MNQQARQQLIKGVIAVSPLCVAVIPWGILAGSYAIEVGMTMLEAQAMSAIVYAGSAQLVALGMINSGVGLGTLLLTTFFITSRHFLYGLTMRDRIAPMSLKWRLLFGHWLTDELFAICGTQPKEQFDRWFALGVAGGFYFAWNIISFIGIVLGSYIPNLTEYGLEFAVAATFIAIVFPLVKNIPVAATVLVSLVLSVLLTRFNIDGALIIASVSGMATGYVCETYFKDSHEGESS